MDLSRFITSAPQSSTTVLGTGSLKHPVLGQKPTKWQPGLQPTYNQPVSNGAVFPWSEISIQGTLLVLLTYQHDSTSLVPAVFSDHRHEYRTVTPVAYSEGKLMKNI